MKILKYGLIIIKNKNMLLNRKKGTDFWLIPGGKPEGKETPEQCIVREIREEHNCAVDVDSLKFFGEFTEKAANEPDAIIHLKAYSGNISGKPFPGREIEEQMWFAKDSDPKKLSPLLKYKLIPHLIIDGLL